MTGTELEELLRFVSSLGKEMLSCGATRARVNAIMEETLIHYDLDDIAVQSLSSIIHLGARTHDGISSNTMTQVDPMDLDMITLQRLERLSHKVRDTKPNPMELMPLLDEVLVLKKKRPHWLLIIGHILARIALCRIFGGNILDSIVVLINTLILYGLRETSSKVHLNNYISTFIFTFITGVISALSVWIGLGHNFYVIVLTNVLFFFPGISMVNSARNVICGYELNGVHDFMKVLMSTLAIVGGVAASFYIFGDAIPLSIEESFRNVNYATDILQDVELIGLTFVSSFGFGIIFNVETKDWIFAGLAGALVRTVYIFAQIVVPHYVLLYMVIAALSAGLYAEIMAIMKKSISTYFLYPCIIPLIPGGTLAYAMFGIIWNNQTLLGENGIKCLLALLGLSVGFALASSIAFYIKKIKVKNLLIHKRKNRNG